MRNLILSLLLTIINISIICSQGIENNHFDFLFDGVYPEYNQDESVTFSRFQVNYLRHVHEQFYLLQKEYDKCLLLKDKVTDSGTVTNDSFTILDGIIQDQSDENKSLRSIITNDYILRSSHEEIINSGTKVAKDLQKDLNKANAWKTVLGIGSGTLAVLVAVLLAR